MGCHISPKDASSIEDVFAATGRWHQGDDTLLSGEFNAYLAKPEGSTCVEYIAAAPAASVLEEMSDHFLPN